jgi:beta-glucuronidase
VTNWNVITYILLFTPFSFISSVRESFIIPNSKIRLSLQFVNGALVASHAGGHVPFRADVTSVLLYGQENLISVAVNNTLTDITVPQGELQQLQT